MEDAYQIVDMGSTPVRVLQDSFVGPEKPFRLRLRRCGMNEGQNNSINRIRVTFDGVRGETPDRFSVSGVAKGIDLQITDRYGYPARQGQPMPPLFIHGNSDELNYTLQVIRNSNPLTAGNYSAILQFKIDYE
ncbi:fimbrial protein [Escherichia coli]|uniref:fimbrial protein n=1 Tax=Escherichia coli TaxID=562 RepID=UPI003209B5B1